MFDIQTGALIPSNNLKTGIVPRVSVKQENNGILGYFDTESIKHSRHYSNFISVNFFGNCFYQQKKSSVEMKVHVLKIPNYEYTKRTGLYITSILTKLLKGKFTYGTQLSSSKLKNKDFFIALPITPIKEIDFDLMETYISAIQKLCIKQIIKWKDKQIKTTKKVIG